MEAFVNSINNASAEIRLSENEKEDIISLILRKIYK